MKGREINSQTSALKQTDAQTQPNQTNRWSKKRTGTFIWMNAECPWNTVPFILTSCYFIDPLHKWHLCTSLASHSCFKTKKFSHECEAKDVWVLLFKFRRHLCSLSGLNFQLAPVSCYLLTNSSTLAYWYEVVIWLRLSEFISFLLYY